MYEEYIDVLVDAVSWRFSKDQIKCVETNTNALLQSVSLFENMYQLLLEAEKITIVLVDGTVYNLFAWKSEKGIGGWLCEPRNYTDVSIRPAKYKLLQSALGNIVETFGFESVRDDWLCNLNWFLGAEELEFGLNSWKDYFEERCEDENKVPILERQGQVFDIDNLFIMAEEANGNLLLCDANTEEVFLFAHDHCFENISVCGDLPEYTFYTVEGGMCFWDYIELVAKQWQKYLHEQ